MGPQLGPHDAEGRQPLGQAVRLIAVVFPVWHKNSTKVVQIMQRWAPENLVKILNFEKRFSEGTFDQIRIHRALDYGLFLVNDMQPLPLRYGWPYLHERCAMC